MFTWKEYTPLSPKKIHKFYLVKNGVDTSKDRESNLSDVFRKFS